MKEIQQIARWLDRGEVDEAHRAWLEVNTDDESTEYEVREVVRQAIISYLKKGHVYNARRAEVLFALPKEAVDEAVKQAVLSTFRDGNVDRVKELRNDLPISKSLADELVDFCASWGKPRCLASLQAVLV